MPPTLVVELTPPGRAAVAVVLVAGPAAAEAIAGNFAPATPRPAGDFPLARIFLGRWGGTTGEEIIVCRRALDQFEVHCHGGTAAVGAIIDALVAKGCQLTSWQEWLRLSSPDPIVAAAQTTLADAPTARTAAVLLDQFNGAFTAAIRKAIAAIVATDWSQAANLIAELLARQKLGLHLTKAWRVVFAGPPNVGKSSLINAVAGYQRAIVSPTPGTTRDVVTARTAINGWPVEMADTAGLRLAQDEVELAGVELARAAMASADLVILVHDATAGWPPLAKPEFNEAIRTDVLNVWNKIDLVAEAERCRLQSNSANPISEIRNPQFVSALTGENIAALTASIPGILVPSPPPIGAAVPFLKEHVDALAFAARAIERRDTAAATSTLQAMLPVALATENRLPGVSD
jgi:tRNA modification GTPase